LVEPKASKVRIFRRRGADDLKVSGQPTNRSYLLVWYHADELILWSKGL
jgi:hypothetical protein